MHTELLTPSHAIESTIVRSGSVPNSSVIAWLHPCNSIEAASTPRGTLYHRGSFAVSLRALDRSISRATPPTRQDRPPIRQYRQFMEGNSCVFMVTWLSVTPVL